MLVPEGVNRRIFDKGISDWRTARERAEKGESTGQQGEVFVERRGKKKNAK